MSFFLNDRMNAARSNHLGFDPAFLVREPDHAIRLVARQLIEPPSGRLDLRGLVELLTVIEKLRIGRPSGAIRSYYEVQFFFSHRFGKTKLWETTGTYRKLSEAIGTLKFSRPGNKDRGTRNTEKLLRLC